MIVRCFMRDVQNTRSAAYPQSEAGTARVRASKDVTGTVAFRGVVEPLETLQTDLLASSATSCVSN
jgi:hypothetical protein